MTLTHFPRAAAESIAKKNLLRFHVCGSAGAGKSTLIARLIHEVDPLAEDMAAPPVSEPRLASDVAYRLFSTERRNFIAADTRGHERHTRDLVTGVSNADLGVVVVDVGKGISSAARRQTYLTTLLGIRQVVVVINKMDAAGYSEDAFARVEQDFRGFAEQLGLQAVTCIPVSALAGDNLVSRSAAMSWYQGPTLLGVLERADLEETRLREQALRLPIEWVSGGPTGRGLSGTIAAGRVRRGDRVRLQPSGRLGRIARIASDEGDVDQAAVGQAVSITLDSDIDVSLGEWVVPADQPAEVSDQFEATVIWRASAPLLPGRSYIIKLGPQTATATVAPLKHRVNPSTLERMAAKALAQNEIGVCNLQLDRAVVFDPHKVNRDTGGFLLIDAMSGELVAVGMLHFALRRAKNVHWQALDVNKAARASIKGQRACLLWYTGLSGAGKSTIANLVDKRLYGAHHHTYVLDGDNVRHGLNKDLGFTNADRVENIRRIAEVAKLMVDAGLIVGAAFISPFRAERQMARALLKEGEFIEIFIDAPLAVAEGRDPKGLYKKARRGDLKNFTGIDSPYEPPEDPELRIDTTSLSAEGAAEQVVAFLKDRGILDP
ncbi:MAG: adenylyl-sulfate kinase [Polyangiaceae bacterium]|nr:adenylyl-sulfate kinase [Polyangiaceae bacterium]